MDSAREHGFGERYLDARFVPMAVANPDAIFTGLRRPNQNESLAHSVRPEYDPDGEEESRRTAGMPRCGQVFMAFVEIRDMGFVVFDWSWREEDPNAPGHPLNHEIDFAGKVWPHEPD